jgi:hypothetical protein
MPSSGGGATASHQYRRSKASTRHRSSRDGRRDIASITASRNSRACHGSPQQAHSVQPSLPYSHNRRCGWWTKLRQSTIADPTEPGHRYFFWRSIRRISASAAAERPRMAVMSSCFRSRRRSSARTRQGRLRGMGLSVDRHAGHPPLCRCYATSPKTRTPARLGHPADRAFTSPSRPATQGGVTSMITAVPTTALSSCMVTTSPGRTWSRCPGTCGASRTVASSPGARPGAPSAHGHSSLRTAAGWRTFRHGCSWASVPSSPSSASSASSPSSPSSPSSSKTK